MAKMVMDKTQKQALTQMLDSLDSGIQAAKAVRPLPPLSDEELWEADFETKALYTLTKLYSDAESDKAGELAEALTILDEPLWRDILAGKV